MTITFHSPWRAVPSGQEHAVLQHRYDTEITSAHPLAGLRGKIIARSDASDDVLVQTSNECFAIVHLTWGQGGAGWPGFVVYDSPDAVSRSMMESS